MALSSTPLPIHTNYTSTFPPYTSLHPSRCVKATLVFTNRWYYEDSFIPVFSWDEAGSQKQLYEQVASHYLQEFIAFFVWTFIRTLLLQLHSSTLLIDYHACCIFDDQDNNWRNLQTPHVSSLCH